MAQNDEVGRNGEQKAPRGSRALRVASKGLGSMRDLANFSIAHSIDILQGNIGVKDAHASLRGIGETRRLIVDGQRMGCNKEVIDIEAEAVA